MRHSEAKEKSAEMMLQKYMEKEDVFDLLKFVNRFEETSHRYAQLEGWEKFAKKVLSEQEYKRFMLKLHPFDEMTPEKEELKTKMLDVALKISRNKAGLYDVIDELGMSMDKYIYYLKQLTYRHKALGASVYRNNGEYYNMVSSYNKPGALTCSYPTLGKQTHNELIKFIEEHDLPVNNITYTEAYNTFRQKGLIKLIPMK